MSSGRRVTIGGQQTTIVGVMPRGFYFPTPEQRAWRPLTPGSCGPRVRRERLAGTDRRSQARCGWPAEVARELERITRMLGERFTYPAAWDKTKNAHVTPVHEYLLGNVRDPAAAPDGRRRATAADRRCERGGTDPGANHRPDGRALGSRRARGESPAHRAADRHRVDRRWPRLLGIAGAVIATVGFSTLVASLPVQHGLGEHGNAGVAGVRASRLRSRWRLVWVSRSFRCARSCVGRLDVRERSEEGLRRGTRRVHAGLVVAQVTLAVMLVSGASLLIRSVERIRSIDTGFSSSGVITFDLMREAGTVTPGSGDQFYRSILERVEALPGVTSAGFTNRLPVRDGGWQGPMTIEGKAEFAGAQRPNSLIRTATVELPGDARDPGERGAGLRGDRSCRWCPGHTGQ